MALDRGGPGYAWLVSGALLLMVLSPLVRPTGYDSFPWSSFPMFGHGLPHARTTVHHLVGFDAAGQRRIVPPAQVANDEVLQAEATLRRAVRGGRKTSAALCKQVAARLADDPDWSTTVRLELISERYDAITYFAGDTAPIAPGKTRARCKLVRPGDPIAQPGPTKKKRPKKIRRRPPINLSPGTSEPNLSRETSPAKPTNLSPGTSPTAPGAPTNLSPGTSPTSPDPSSKDRPTGTPKTQPTAPPANTPAAKPPRP